MAKLIHIKFDAEWESDTTDSFAEFVEDTAPQGTYLKWDDNEVLMFEQDFDEFIVPYMANCYECKLFVNNGSPTSFTADMEEQK